MEREEDGTTNLYWFTPNSGLHSVLTFSVRFPPSQPLVTLMVYNNNHFMSQPGSRRDDKNSKIHFEKIVESPLIFFLLENPF